MYAKKESIYPAYVSKHNSNRVKQVIYLMISYGEGWHYLGVRKLSALLIGITLKHKSSLHSFRTKSKLESHKKVCENKFFCAIVKPSSGTKILDFNQYQKSDKPTFIIYTDLECLKEKDWWM